MKSSENFIPNIIGLSVDDAKKQLNKHNISYKKEIKTVLSFKKRGTIVKTNPDNLSENKKGEEVELYQSSGIFILIIPFFVVLLLLIGGCAINKFIINRVTAPELTVEPELNNGQQYRKDAIVKVTKDSKSRYKITHYDYCISDSVISSQCDWKETNTKNVQVFENGHHYVFIRGVDEKNNKSKPTYVEVYIDNNSPLIESVKVIDLQSNNFTIKTIANDDSNIKYYYSLDNKNYNEDGDNHLFDNLTPNTKYNVYVKVVDDAGNEAIVKIEITTLKQDVKGVEEDNTNNNNGNSQNNDSNQNNNDNSNNKDDEELPIEENKWDIPKITLDGVPASITYGDSYKLPTYVDFGNDNGTYSCTVSNIKYDNTELIPVGTHTITCVAKSNHGKTALINKDITVEVGVLEDETLDGWILYNLYYPEESYNWQWRLDGVNGIRTGYDGTDWQDYTGPILVKVEDIENIYIRYDIDGETYIVTPKGKTTVDIQPNKWTLGDNETTKVNIVYDKDANVKEYRINGGTWMTYEGEFEVGPNTLIDARVSKNQDIYNNVGDYVTTKTINNTDSAYISKWVHNSNSNNPTGPSVDPTKPIPSQPPKPGNPSPVTGNPIPPVYPEDIILDGPTITADPTTNGVEETTITMTSKYSGTIYYSINNGAYSAYTSPFAVYDNCTIYAYIITDEGVQSRISYYRVSNIRKGSLPWVGITASPSNYLDGNQKKVTVSINASNYDANTLEYSFNNIIYQKYTGSFDITQSTTIYARAKNSDGYAYDRLSINTINPPIKKDKLDIGIFGNPSNEIEGLVNKVTVTISYDSKATIKKYSMDGRNWKDYTGPFVIDKNMTVHAYAEATNAEGYVNKGFDYLTTGISQPVFYTNTSSLSYTVKVDIHYDRTASKKLYRINSGEWLDYESPFMVEENCIIEAYNENALGYNASNSIAITNIIPRPQYTTLDKGMYYLIKPNYPDTSNENTREYRWKDNNWKKYNGIGVILIKPEYNGKISIKDGIKVIDNGVEYIFKEHYYQLDKPLIEEINNLYIRWNNNKPDAPKIILENDGPVFEDTITIDYNSRLTTKLYKIVYENGEQTEWLKYEGPFKVDKNNTVVYAKGLTKNQVESDIAEKILNNIDEINPSLTVEGDTTTKKQSIQLMAKARDNLAVGEVRYIKGAKELDSFDDALNIGNYSLVTIDENDTYTFYAKDEAGNIVFKQVEVNCIDKDAPNVLIKVLTTNLSPSVDVKMEFGDSVTRQYSIGNSNNYQNYTDTITINSLDVADLANKDGTLTIYAKGIDEAGNETVVSEKIYTLDLDIFAEPIIHTGDRYGLITKKGIINSNFFTVTYDNSRDDLDNEIKIGDADYKIYDGIEYIDEVDVYARSIKGTTGLTREVHKYVTPLSDALRYSAYDKKADTYDTVEANNYKRIDVDNDGSYKEILIRSSSEGEAKVELYGPTGLLASEFQLSSTDTTITLPSGTSKIHFVSGNKDLKIYELEFKQTYKTINGSSILSILNKNLNAGRYIFSVNDEMYPVHLYVLNGNQTITENTQYGDSSDVGNGASYAQNMVIVKVNGDYTVNEGVTVEPYHTEYGGPKGFTLYVTGKLTNNGTINNSHGAYAKGQDVYLWKNTDGTYEYVPAKGAVGGTSLSGRPGVQGTHGTGRQTGGGGSGGAWDRSTYNGATGTSYSGGPGSAGYGPGGFGTYQAPSEDGGSGGITNAQSGGAGNPGGTGGYGYRGQSNPTASKGSDGTGGLLVIYANEYNNNGTLTTTGSKGGSSTDSSGGSSGGGSINIFTNQTTNIDALGINTETRYNEILGSFDIKGGPNVPASNFAGGAGGNGTINIGQIRNGQYCDLKDCIEEDIENFAASITKTGDSILNILEDKSLTSGYYLFKTNGQSYPVHLYVLDGNQTITDNTVYGDVGDVSQNVAATTTTAAYKSFAQNMVIVKVNGDYTINEGVTVEPYYTEYGGPKGFTLYVTGKLTNNGTINNSHGAYAKGQDVYLWKNTDGTYEYVPAKGAVGGTSLSGRPGVQGTHGTGRQTGGGGSGGSWDRSTYNGATGTSYSGGPGSAGYGPLNTGTYQAPDENGGTGGTTNMQSGGAGNPGGTGGSGYRTGANPAKTKGSDGTGGLLIIYANEYNNNGTLTTTGSTGGSSTESSGGSSGGGSINIFTNQSTNINSLGVNTETKYSEMLGKYNISGGVSVSGSPFAGGAGGTGTINIGEIRNGQYRDLKDCIEEDKTHFNNAVTKTGDSILNILEDKSLTTGYYLFKTNGQSYPVHLYVLDGNQIITENTVYGDEGDISRNIAATNTSDAYRALAQNMVIVKVNGDYTINEGVTVEPYYTEYGGPKGFTLYVTGKLTNNGIIDNSHGAYAKGQDVYLWKNTDGTYEYVPAKGAVGGTSLSGRPGVQGTHGTGRQTGGGGSGGSWDRSTYNGATGTSYSGGPGSAGYGPAGFGSYQAPNENGGSGGITDAQSGGAGNPGGTGGYGYRGQSNPTASKGSDGTGGLLVIYANEYNNNGTLTTTGSKGGSSTDSSGGSSGGGSINIFTNQVASVNNSDIDTQTRYNEILGKYNVSGGPNVPASNFAGGAGGNGTINIGQIRNGQYRDLKDCIEEDKASNSSSTNGINSNTSTSIESMSIIDKIRSLLPKIKLFKSNTNYSLSVNYNSDGINQYSLDLGNTWINYTGDITLTDNCTIIARTIDEEGKVIAASSFTVTKYTKEVNVDIVDDKVEETTTTNIIEE